MIDPHVVHSSCEALLALSPTSSCSPICNWVSLNGPVFRSCLSCSLYPVSGWVVLILHLSLLIYNHISIPSLCERINSTYVESAKQSSSSH